LNPDQKKSVIAVIVFAILLICIFNFTYSLVQFPSEHRVLVGQELKLNIDSVPERMLKALNVSVVPQDGLLLRYKGDLFRGEMINFGGEWPVAATTGTANLQLRIFGIIPLRNFVVNVVPQYEVIPGGQSIGVMLQSKGILVVGYSHIETQSGSISPAKDVGIRTGDIVISTNGKGINSEEMIARIIDNCGKEQKNIRLRVRRNGEIFEFSVKPQFCSQTQRYRIGLFIRDNAAGVGTLTFYDPKTKKYGALGHVVSNGAGEQRIEIKDGKIVESIIQGIEQGKKGKPGEKIGVFIPDRGLSGSIEKNTFHGIFGRLTRLPEARENKAVPVALAGEIRRGPAKIRTVINGSQVEEFDISILKIMPHQKENGKGLIIKITDKRLLSQTGGIIQGMSGSPIIQNGKLVGAVTHVFINEPSQGYGILAEWMLMECGLLQQKRTPGDVSVGNEDFLLSHVS